jgi:hypothetical protein
MTARTTIHAIPGSRPAYVQPGTDVKNTETKMKRNETDCSMLSRTHSRCLAAVLLACLLACCRWHATMTMVIMMMGHARNRSR